MGEWRQAGSGTGGSIWRVVERVADSDLESVLETLELYGYVIVALFRNARKRSAEDTTTVIARKRWYQGMHSPN